MKKRLITLCAVTVSIAAVYLTSCNKETEMQTKQKNTDPTEQSILNFKTKVASGLKSAQTMSVDSAVWYIEAALNYSYCTTLENSAYENCEIIVDSVKFDLLYNNSLIPFETVTKLYSDFDNYLVNYSKNLDFSFKKYDVADIVIRDKKIICKFVLFAKNSTKAQSGPQANLSHDWKTGAGSCDGGTCDGIIPELDAMKVLTACLNDKQNTVYPGYYLTNITPSMTFFVLNPTLGSDTLLLDTLCTEYSPCIYSPKMYELLNFAKILKSRYIAPAGWAIAEGTYQIGCNTTTHLGYKWYFGSLYLSIGKKQYKNSI